MFLNYTLTYRLLIRNAFAPVAALHIILFIIIASGEMYLQKFSERVVLQWWHYTLPVLILLLIMFCTVATLVWKAAKSNPVEALKYE